MPGTFFTRCIPAGLLVTATALACSSIPPLPAPTPQPVVPDTSVPAVTPAPSATPVALSAGTRRFEVAWTTHNQDLDTGVRDSLATSALVSVTLVPGSTRRLDVMALISWGGADSLKPDTLRGSLETDGAGFRQDGLVSGCPRERVRDFSPLLLRLLLLRAMTDRQTVDSLSYRSCASGVVRSSEGAITWDGEPRQAASSLVVAGRLTADSSRALPLRLTGQVSGRARQESDGTAVLALEGELVTALEARGPGITQRVRQTVRFRARALP